jgi:synaptobrevin family protein YKT6
VAFALINRVLEEFLATIPRDQWLTCTSPVEGFVKLKEMLIKYQNPHEADPIMRVQKELDETKIILVLIFLFIY